MQNDERKSLNGPTQNAENVEVKKVALRTINEINNEINMPKININFTLQGESEI